MLLVLALLPPDEAAAQTDVGISGQGLMSIQPIDDTYVGGPYLSEGIGGLAAGLGGSLSVILPNGFALAGEYTTAWYEQEQYGRLVRGAFPLESVPATTRLRDSLLHVLAGYAYGATTRTLLYGGVSLKLDAPTMDGLEIEEYETDDAFPVALTGGVDLLHRLSTRAALVIGGRYTHNPRNERLQYLGIGSAIIRVGAGVRIRLN